MNIFTDALYLFAYIIVLLYFKLPDVINNNYLTHKLYLFVAIFAYHYVISLIKKIKHNCKINANIILKHSLTMSLYAILGYSIYVDLLFMDWSKDYFGDINEVNPIKRYFVITLIIVTFITLIQMVGMLFLTDIPDECDN